MNNPITGAEPARNISEISGRLPFAGVLSASADNTPKKGIRLGSNARTEASLQPRGLQPIHLTSTTTETVDPETGEIIKFKTNGQGLLVVDKTPQQVRSERWALKSVVNSIFPTSKTGKCSRMRIPHDSVRVLKDPKHGKAHYSGLVRCGSVWWCPLCASKIAERRRLELIGATDSAKTLGLEVLLMTCTVPHGLGDDINQVLSNMRNAWRKLTTSRAGKDMRKLMGVVGTIRALEVTHGQNGFHPHFHVLLFVKPGFSVQSFQTAFYPIWRDACVKSGLPAPSEKHGLRVDDGSWAAKYASKWGLEDEMTKGHLKTSKGIKGLSPWDMLREVLKNGCQASRALFQVYAHAFKGQRQLYWSNGLRALLTLDRECTDEELANNTEEDAIELAELTVEQWRAVLFNRAEAALLDISERDPALIQPFLSALVAKSTHSVMPPGHFASECQQSDLWERFFSNRRTT